MACYYCRGRNMVEVRGYDRNGYMRHDYVECPKCGHENSAYERHRHEMERREAEMLARYELSKVTPSPHYYGADWGYDPTQPRDRDITPP